MNAKREYTAVMLVAAASALAVVALDAVAHHSDSMYFIDDRAADGGAIRIEGTISKVRWINPHTEFFVDVPSADGASTAWAIETDSVNQLRALGWSEETLQVGDQVAVVVSKSKFDDAAGRLRDMLVYPATPAEPATIYLEHKAGPQWEAPLQLYQEHTSCPGTAVYDPARQPGKETLLCATLDTDELAAAREAFGDKVLVLRAKR
jgi:hypothetical protein